MFSIKYVLIGFVIGIGCVAPGVSGGAMAVSFGVYERMIDCAVHLKSRLKKEFGFLMSLAVGGVIGIAVFALGLNFLFTRYEFIMRMLFAGIMLGTFPSVYTAACKNGYKWYYPLLFIITMAASVVCFGAVSNGADAPINTLTASVSGAIIGIGTVVPGVSASAVLMALGLYKPLLAQFTQLNLTAIIPTALGVVISIALLLKGVEWLFAHCYGAASFIFFGLLGGSTAAIVPKISAINTELFISLAAAVAGMSFAVFFGKKFGAVKNKAAN